MVEIVAGPKPEAVPGEWNRYARDVPISTDVQSQSDPSLLWSDVPVDSTGSPAEAY